MYLLLIFLVIFLIIFVPIPIYLKVSCTLNDYYIKIYGITLLKKKTSYSKMDGLNKSNIKEKNKAGNHFKSNYIKYKSILSDINNSKFKPKMIFYFNFDYSLAEASKTAILFGILYEFPSIIYSLLSMPFKIYKFKVNINPIFEDKFLVKAESSSIIFISIANTIHITHIFHKYKRVKEVSP